MFDPYHLWLGIHPAQQPPTYYQLLGISPEEVNTAVIEEAAVRQAAHLRHYQAGEHAAECTRLLNEIARAHATLIHPARRKAYDAFLHKQAAKTQPKMAKRTQLVAAPQVPPKAEQPAAPPRQPAAVNEFAALTQPPAPRASLKHDPPEVPSVSRIKRRLRQQAAAQRRTIYLAIALGLIVLLGIGGFFILQAVLTSDLKEPRQADAEGRKTAPAPRVIWETRPARPRPAPIADTRRRPDPPQPEPPPKVDPPAPEPGPKVLKADAELPGHAAPVTSLAFSPDSNWLLSASGPDLWLWDVKNRQVLYKFPKHGSPVHCVAISADGHYALTGSGSFGMNFGKLVPEDCKVRLWDLKKGKLLHTFPAQRSPVRSVAFSTDGRRALSAGGALEGKAAAETPVDCTVHFWDVEHHKELQFFEGPTKPILDVAFADEDILASVCATGVQSWHEHNSQEAANSPFKTLASGAVFSQDGRRLLVYGDDKVVWLWTWSLGSLHRTVCYDASKSQISCLAISRHGLLALIGCGYQDVKNGKKVWLDCGVRLVDLDTQQQLACLEGPTEPVMSVALSADKQYAAAGGPDHVIRLWKLKTP
jgi:hypothetical protein